MLDTLVAEISARMRASKALGETLSQIVLLLDTALGRPAPVPPDIAEITDEWLGKLPQIRDLELQQLVDGLLSAATEANGKFTFNMNDESGTLADALRLLRDHLPEGLVADPLPVRTIQRVKTAFFRRRLAGPRC
jgi:hypothetical protein